MILNSAVNDQSSDVRAAAIRCLYPTLLGYIYREQLQSDRVYEIVNNLSLVDRSKDVRAVAKHILGRMDYAKKQLEEMLREEELSKNNK